MLEYILVQRPIKQVRPFGGLVLRDILFFYKNLSNKSDYNYNFFAFLRFAACRCLLLEEKFIARAYSKYISVIHFPFCFSTPKFKTRWIERFLECSPRSLKRTLSEADSSTCGRLDKNLLFVSAYGDHLR